MPSSSSRATSRLLPPSKRLRSPSSISMLPHPWPKDRSLKSFHVRLRDLMTCELINSDFVPSIYQQSILFCASQQKCRYVLRSLCGCCSLTYPFHVDHSSSSSGESSSSDDDSSEDEAPAAVVTKPTAAVPAVNGAKGKAAGTFGTYSHPCTLTHVVQ